MVVSLLQSFIPRWPLALAAVVLVAGGCAADEPGRHRIVPKEPGQLQVAEDLGTPQAEGGLSPVERGEALFRGRGICATCHGPDGTGTQIAPNLTDDEWLHIDEPITVEKIAEIIQAGVSQPIRHPGVMPPRGGGMISDEDIEAIAAYVMSLRY